MNLVTEASIDPGVLRPRPADAPAYFRAGDISGHLRVEPPTDDRSDPLTLKDGIPAQLCSCSCCGQRALVSVPCLARIRPDLPDFCLFRHVSCYFSLPELRSLVRKAGLKSESAYCGWQDLPAGAPYDPTFYPGWTTWADFLGIPSYRSRQELCRWWSEHEDAFRALSLDMKLRVLDEYPDELEATSALLGISPDGLLGMPVGDVAAGLRGGEATSQQQKNDGFESVEALVASVRGLTRLMPQGLSGELQADLRFLYEDSMRKLWARGISLFPFFDELARHPELCWLREPLEQKASAWDRIKGAHDNYRPCVIIAVEAMRHSRRWIEYSEMSVGKSRIPPAVAKDQGIGTVAILAANSTLYTGQWEREIREVDPDAHVFCVGKGKLDARRRNYLLCNPEKLQHGRAQAVIDEILSTKPGLFVVDEYTSTMPKDEEIAEQGERLKAFRNLIDSLPGHCLMLYMGGTAMRTDLDEPINFLEMFHDPHAEGTLSHLRGKPSLSRAHAVRMEFLRNGSRLLNTDPRPKLHLELVPYNVTADVARKVSKAKGLLAKSCILARDKMRWFAEEFPRQFPDIHSKRQHPIWFTTEVDAQGAFGENGPVEAIAASLADGPVFKFTGILKEFDDWKDCNAPITHLVVSEAFCEGVDGAQKKSNFLGIVEMPFTAAGLRQLVGRVHRTNAGPFLGGEVFVVIPVAMNVRSDCERLRRVLRRDEFLGIILDGPEWYSLFKGLSQQDAEKKISQMHQQANREFSRRKRNQCRATYRTRAARRVQALPAISQAVIADRHTPQDRAHSIFSTKSVRNLETGEWPVGFLPRDKYFEGLQKEQERWRASMGCTPQEHLIKTQIELCPEKRSLLLACGPDIGSALLLPNVVLADLYYPHPRVLNVPVTRTGFPDGSFDIVACVLGLYASSLIRGIAEMHRVLAPKGVLWVVKSCRDNARYMKGIPAEMRRLGMLPLANGYVFENFRSKFRFFGARK